MLEKVSFGAAAVVLYLSNRIPPLIMIFASIDLLLGALFLAAYAKTRGAEERIS